MHAGRGWADTLQARKPASSGGYQPAVAPDKSKGEGGRAQMDPGELLRHPVATLLSSDAEKSNRVKMTSEAASLASPARLRTVCTCE